MISGPSHIVVPGQNGIQIATRLTDDHWDLTRVMPGRSFTCLVSDPSDPNRLYAGTLSEGLFISSDAGRTWTGLGLLDIHIKSIAVSPVNPAHIYVGTKPAGLYLSKDGGQSWSQSDGFERIPNRWWWFSPAEPPDRRPYVIQIACSPGDSNLLLAGVEFGGVFRSTDGGATWSRHCRRAFRDCHALIFHREDGQRIYQAAGGGMAISQDAGQSWLRANHGLAKRYGMLCAVDPANANLWYACLGSSPFNAYGKSPSVYLYRRAANDTWEAIGWEPHPLHQTPTALVTIAGLPGLLLVGLRDGRVRTSEDYGSSWAELPIQFDSIWHWMVAGQG